MIANETIAAHIAFLRVGLDEVKQDVRKLTADSTTIQTTLRDKIDQSHAALSAGQAALSDRMDRNFETLNVKIDAVSSTLSGRIEAVSFTLNNKIDAVSVSLTNKIEAGSATLNNKIDVVSATLNDKIDAVSATLNDKIDATSKELHAKIDTVNQDLGQKIDNLGTAFAELRGLHKTVLWVCGGIVTIVTVSVSVGNALGWF